MTMAMCSTMGFACTCLTMKFRHQRLHQNVLMTMLVFLSPYKQKQNNKLLKKLWMIIQVIIISDLCFFLCNQVFSTSTSLNLGTVQKIVINDWWEGLKNVCHIQLTNAHYPFHQRMMLWKPHILTCHLYGSGSLTESIYTPFPNFFWNCFSFGEESRSVNIGPNVIFTMLLVPICRKPIPKLKKLDASNKLESCLSFFGGKSVCQHFHDFSWLQYAKDPIQRLLIIISQRPWMELIGILPTRCKDGSWNPIVFAHIRRAIFCKYHDMYH